MPTDPFWGNIFKRNHTQDIVAVLKQIPIFNDINYLNLVKLSKFLHRRTYFRNEVIFHEKEPGVGLYIVKSGEIKISISNLDGHDCELTRLGPGTFFGEISLIDEAPRSAMATALEDTELLGFFRPDLMTLVDRDPRLASQVLYKLATVLGKRLRETNKELKRLQTGVAQ